MMVAALLATSTLPREAFIGCNVRSISAAERADKLYGGTHSLDFYRQTAGGLNTWKSWGHVDNVIHRMPDDPFEVRAVVKPDRIHLNWHIHRAPAVGILSDAPEGHGEMLLDLQVGYTDIRNGRTFHLKMSGSCALKRNPFIHYVPKATT